MTSTTMQLLALSSALAACAATTAPGGGQGDDTGGEDGGVRADGDGGEDVAPSAKFIESSLRDERGDVITFTGGQPGHAHSGPTIKLDGTGCPAVHKHAYLMDQVAPAFGYETTPNPLQWKIELSGLAALDLAASAYRVRTASNDVVLDWTTLPAREDRTVTIPLYRGGLPAIPALGERRGQFFLDVRTRDLAGNATMTSACWDHQPLAAPLDVQSAQVVPEGLAAMTFAASSPISHLMTDARDVPVFEQRFVHTTSERLQVAIDVAQPVGLFSKQAVDDILQTGSGSSLACGTTEWPSDDPRCVRSAPLADPPDAAAGGPLSTGTWSLHVIDELTGAPPPACVVTGLRVVCDLPGRHDAPPRAYRVVLRVRSVRELFPAPTGPFGEHALWGLTYTGLPAQPMARCALMRSVETSQDNYAFTCASWYQYLRIVALDQARLIFQPVKFSLGTSASPDLSFTPPSNVPPAVMSTPAYEWDAGNDDLPGPK